MLYTQFLNISFSMLLYYSSQQKCLIPPNTCFCSNKQKPSIQFKFSKSYLQSPLFSLRNNNNSWTWELNTHSTSVKIFISKTQSTQVYNDEIRVCWNYCIVWAIRQCSFDNHYVPNLMKLRPGYIQINLWWEKLHCPPHQKPSCGNGSFLWLGVANYDWKRKR
jgi:hypothetical protein